MKQFFLLSCVLLGTEWLQGQCTFTFTPTNPCPGEIVTFTVGSPDPTATYTWDLDGDGNYNNGTGISVTFAYPLDTLPKSYTVRVKENTSVACGSPKTIQVKAGPRALITPTAGATLSGNVIVACGAEPSVEISLRNSSAPKNFLQSNFTMNWGDGSPVETLVGDFGGTLPPVTHTYLGLGYKYLVFTATHINGCSSSTNYSYFHGTTPASPGLSPNSSTTGLCAPSVLSFNLTPNLSYNHLDNSPGTTYEFLINGNIVNTYTQNNLPAVYSYNFSMSSCGFTNSNGDINAYDLQVKVKNPCGDNGITYRPIRLSTKPIPDFSIEGPANYCPNAEYLFTNTSTNINEVINAQGNCIDTLTANWTISGSFGVDWVVTGGGFSGSNKIKVKFLKSGTYTIKMKLSQHTCGPTEITKTITILEPPNADATVQLSNTANGVVGCLPLRAAFNNLSTGYMCSYNWTVSPAMGWQFASGSSATSVNPTIDFNTPGIYTVTLTNTNVCSTDTWVKVIEVKTKPSVTLPMFPASCQTASLCFSSTNTTYNSGGGTISSYNWSFPGGMPSSSTTQYPCNINYSASVATTYTVTVTASNECGSTTATTSFEIQVPPVITMPPDMTVCINAAPFQLNATPANGNWVGSGVSQTGLFNPNTAGLGMKILTYNYSSGVCTAPKTMIITVVALPTVTAGPNLKTCINETAVTLSGGSPSAGTWTASPAAVINGNVFNPSASGVNTYTLTYSFTDADNCSNSATTTIIVNQLPTVTATPATYCLAPGLVTLPAASPAGGTWSGTGVTGNQFNPTAAGLGSHTLKYTYSDPVTGCSNSVNIIVTVVNPTAINAGVDMSVCVNEPPINLNTGVSPAGGTWSTPSNGLSGFTFTPSQAGVGTHTLTYSIGSENCQVTDSRIITVKALPTVMAGPNLKSCINETAVTLNGGSPSDGTWTASPAAVINGNVFNPSASGVNTYVLTYSFTDANNCSNSDTTTIRVNPLPVVTTLAATYCLTPGLVALPAATPAGGTWSGIGVTGNQFNPTAAGLGPHSLTYNYTDPDPATGCSNSANSIITVISPTSINAGADMSACLNDPPIDLNTGVSPTGGSWSTPSGGLSGSTFTPSQAGAGTHTLTYTIGSGNCLVTDTRVITVKPLPAVNVGPNITVCTNTGLQNLSPTPAGGNWNPVSGLSGNAFNPAQSGPGLFNLTYTYTVAAGCTNSSSMVITVNALPVVSAGDTTYCNNPGNVSLPYASPAGGTWSGTGIAGNQFNPANTPGVDTYLAVYSYTNNNNCTNRDTVSISVISPQTVNAGSDQEFCVSAAPVNLNTNISPAGGTWTISSGNGLSGNTFSPQTAGPGTYTLTYSLGTGNCMVSDTRTILVRDLPVVDAGQPLSACVDKTYLEFAPTPAGGVWTGNGSYTVNVFNPNQSGAGSYTLTYTLTDQNGCSQTDQVVITVFPLPVVTAGDTVYCNTPGAVQLPYASPANGTWSGAGITGNQFNPQNAGGVGSYPAVYAFTNNNICTNRDTVIISVINPQTVNAGADQEFCVSAAPVNLNTNVSPAGGTWTISSGNGLSGNTFSPQTAGPGSFTLSYSVGTGNCKVTDTRSILVKDLPAVDAGLPLKACVDTSSLALAPTPTGGVWTGNGSYTANIFNPNQSGAGDYTLTYTLTDQYGCSQTDQVIITVFPLPLVTAGDTVYCNTPGAVQLPYASPANGTWSGVGITGNQFNPQAAGGVDTYPAVYTYTNNNNCTNRDTALIEVISPAVVNAGVDTSLCVNTATLDLAPGAIPVSGGTWSGTGLQGSVFNPATAQPGIHELTYSVGTGNCRVLDRVKIEVWALPTVQAGSDLSACASDTAIALGGDPSPGVWTSTPTAVLSGVTWNPAQSGVGSYTLTYSHTDTNGCVNRDERVAIVHPLPTPAAGDTTYCNTPGSVLLPYATPQGGTWSGTGISGLQFDPTGAGGTGNYNATYVYIDSNNCTDSVIIEVKVTDPPPISAGLNDTICINLGVLQLSGFIPVSGGTWSGSGISNASTGVFNPEIAGGGLHPLVYTFGTGNCQVWDTTSINVISVPIDAGPDKVTCLNDAPLTLTGFQPSGGVWSGSGIIQSSGVFKASAAGVGTHTLRYQYNDPILDCVFRDSIQVIVNPMPESNFPQPSNSCIDVQIPFLNQSASTFMPFWNFGDGGTSTLSSPMHTYSDTGTYLVSLVTKNQFGCIDTMFRNIFVTRPPTAFFSTTPDSGCAVLNVEFLNQSYGFETTYTWNFGNGQTSNQYNPGVVGFEQGPSDKIYYIKLTVENLCAVREWTDSVKVFPWPQVNFGTNLDTICTGATLSFSNVTLGKPETFYWDFGNGLSSTDSLPDPVTFLTDTSYITYNIALVATNFCGSDTAIYPVVVKPVDVRAFFNVPDLIGCEPYTVEFTNFATLGAPVSWDFGDGNTSSDNSPTHTFQQEGLYKVLQKASSGCGFDTSQVFINVLPAPDVSFQSAPQVCKNDVLSITNTSVTPLSGTIWNFSDGDSSLLYNPAHSWSSAGPFDIKLTGYSALNGCPSTTSKTVNVLELPVIRFTSDKPYGCVPLDINLSNQSLGATYFEWDFGDGNTQLGNTSSHRYETAGQYSVKLRGIDLNGCKNDTVLYYITAHPIPSPSFSLVRDRLCGLPLSVQTVNQTPDAVGYVWDMGNGSTSVQNNPSAQYINAGDYTVKLTATNAFSCKNTVQQTVSAYSIPVADFNWTPDIACAPAEISFDNVSLYTTKSYWRFTDGGSSVIDNPVHTFQLPGIYGATLVASHRDVCFDTLSLASIITIHPSPVASFSYFENLTVPPSGMFQFTDESVDAVEWDWDFGDGEISSDQNPEHRYYYNGPKEVTLLVTSENQCTDDTTRIIIPSDMKGLFVPNAFTPFAGEGDARVFRPRGVGLKEYEIELYSPYGQLLWRSDKLDEGRPAESWDGTFRGEMMPQDVYTWKVTRAVFDDGTIWPGNFDYGVGAGKKIGSVTLIR
jgi:PKD repeat protein